VSVQASLCLKGCSTNVFKLCLVASYLSGVTSSKIFGLLCMRLFNCDPRCSEAKCDGHRWHIAVTELSERKKGKLKVVDILHVRTCIVFYLQSLWS